MLYALFLAIAILFNLRKFFKERGAFISSLVEAEAQSHREMILSHHFYVFTFEGFLALIVAHIISDNAASVGMIVMAAVYVVLLILNFGFFQYFVRYLERQTNLSLRDSFNQHIVKEVRVNFALIMLPILIYSTINWASQDEVFKEWGSFWFVGILANILSVSVLTVICTVIIMLKLIPNREITEPEYLELINKRLAQVGIPHMRVRWIEADFKNAFVVGLKLFRFSNQTMFLGRSLRKTLTMEEFDAVVAHEIAHVANRHIHKRLIDLFKNFLSVIFGSGLLLMVTIGIGMIYWGEDAPLHNGSVAFFSMVLVFGWIIFNYILLFDGIRAHEFEADAYAVIDLGADYGALKSALEKLTSKDDVPEYLKAKAKKPEEKNALAKWFSKTFSTHPDLETRMSFLQEKIDRGLPFNYYVSSTQKIRNMFWKLFQWRVALPLTTAFSIMVSVMVMKVRHGKALIYAVTQTSVEEIINNNDVLSRINSRPQLIGKSLMFYVVKRQDPQLIEYFLKNGANKGKTLVYLSELKDFKLFQKYYTSYGNELSEDEFYLVLRRTASMNFTEGYRFLVNSQRFEDLNQEYKERVSSLHDLAEPKRAPASVK